MQQDAELMIIDSNLGPNQGRAIGDVTVTTSTIYDNRSVSGNGP